MPSLYVRPPARRHSAASALLVLWLFTGGLHAAPASLTNELGMAFIEIPAGEFTMGTEDPVEALFEMPEPEESLIEDETPAHEVRFEQPFYLGRTEVTQKQWLDVMGTKPGPESHWQREDWRELPVVSVSWRRVQEFIAALNERDAMRRYRLSTEAEWEYAARAGTRGLRPFPAEDLSEHAWYIDNSGDVPQPVATRKVNAFGLYDMFGNVWEWTADWYAPDAYAKVGRTDPRGPAGGTRKVRRGGSYHCAPHLVRSGYRATDKPEQAYSVVGFRLVAQDRARAPAQ